VTSPDDMQVVAQGLLDGLVSAAKAGLTEVDGAFVLCYRASDDSCGGAIHAPEVALDSMIGMVVNILGKLRDQQTEALKAASATGNTS
jgi:hypothetical protein